MFYNDGMYFKNGLPRFVHVGVPNIRIDRLATAPEDKPTIEARNAKARDTRRRLAELAAERELKSLK